jgi:hypothetical protein
MSPLISRGVFSSIPVELPTSQATIDLAERWHLQARNLKTHFETRSARPFGSKFRLRMTSCPTKLASGETAKTCTPSRLRDRAIGIPDLESREIRTRKRDDNQRQLPLSSEAWTI